MSETFKAARLRLFAELLATGEWSDQRPFGQGSTIHLKVPYLTSKTMTPIRLSFRAQALRFAVGAGIGVDRGLSLTSDIRGVTAGEVAELLKMRGL